LLRTAPASGFYYCYTIKELQPLTRTTTPFASGCRRFHQQEGIYDFIQEGFLSNSGMARRESLSGLNVFSPSHRLSCPGGKWQNQFPAA
jgi:hypothetical protein